MGNVFNNTMTVRNANINGWEVIVAGSTVGNVYNNTSYFYNVENIAFIDGGFAYGGDGDVWNNTLNFYSGTTGYLHGGHSNNGTAYNNTVNIYGGKVNEAGAGYSNYGDVKFNTLNIYDGEVTDTIYGGRASYSGSGSTGNAIGNILNIRGGKIIGNVYGGWAPDGDSIGNVLNVYGNPDLSEATLYAGKASDTGESSDNHLNIYTSGITANNISGFESLNFYIPADAVDGSKTLLTLTDSAGTDLGQTQVNVQALASADIIPNTKITLVTNTSTAGITSSDITKGSVLSQGVSILYPVNIETDKNSVFATVTGEGTFNEKIKVINKKPVVDIPMIELPDNIGETFPEFDLNNDDIEGSKNLSDVTQIENKGWEIFANAGGGSMRYKTGNGSHVDTTNQNIDIGFARSIGHNIANKMTIAPVIDYQNTNYDSYLPDGTHGRGNSKYKGIGVVLRNMNRGGFYWEGSLKIGRVDTDFASDDLDPTGDYGTVTYETGASVLNGHLKLGKYLRLGKNNLLNVYGFYNHTYQGSANADLSSGEHYNFSSTNAGRARIGYRLTTRTSRISQVYTGLAYQFEYNNGVTATYKGYSSSSDSHSGSSGMLELGWLIKPNKNVPWVVDINTTGWIGNQRGVKAYAKIQKSF